MQTHDWLRESLRSVCGNAFPHGGEIEASGIVPASPPHCPHLEYRFTLETPGGSLPLLLRLYHGMFSVWGGSDTLKSTREYAALRHAHAHGAPVPFAYCFSPSTQPFGHPYLILDPGDGEFYGGMEEGNRPTANEAAAPMAEQMARQHRDAPARHPLIPTAELNGVIRQIGVRIRRLENRELNRLMESCLERVPAGAGAGPALLHGAPGPEKSQWLHGRLRAVAGWEHAAFGDPRWDIAHALIGLRAAGGREAADIFLSKYAETAGKPPADLEFWEGCAAFRNYALCMWLESLDKTSFHSVAGRNSDLLPDKELYREFANLHFG